MRHGETLFNVRKKIQGSCDSPLTQRGIKQAEMAATYFSDIELDHVYSSTSERSCDTAEIVSGNRPYKRLKGLKEMDFGIFEGESEDLSPKDKETFFLAFQGESRQQVRDRMKATCIDIMEQDNHQHVLAVSHAGSCLHFMSNWLDQSEELKKGFPNCTICKYEYENQVFTLLEVIRFDFATLK